MSGPRRLLDEGDAPERDDLRRNLVALFREKGLLFPCSEDELERFEREHGPFEPLARDYVRKLSEAVRARIAAPASDPSTPKPLAAPPAWRPSLAMCRNRTEHRDAETEARLEKHRESLRRKKARRKGAADEPGE